MRQLFRLFFLLVLSLAVPVAVYGIAALAGAFVPRAVADVSPDGTPREIILAQGIIHYDILMPADAETLATFSFAALQGVPLESPEVEWLSVGWGSEAFYTQTGTYGDISLGTTWRAATGDRGAIRIEVYGALPEHPKLRRVTISEAQLSALRQTIRAQMEVVPTPLDVAGFTETDAFFAAQGRFHLFRTCNVWVGKVLAQAGLPMGAWTPTPFAVTASLRWNGHLPD